MDPSPAQLNTPPRPALHSLLLTTANRDTVRREPPQPELPFRLGEAMADGAGRYELIQPVGEGRSARVYVGKDRLMSEAGKPVHVAVKLFPAPVDAEEAEHVLREARRARRIRHHHVASVLDAGITGEGWPYIVQEFIQGEHLEAWRNGRGTVARVATVVALTRDVALGLQAVHDAELVHCDVASRNILVDGNGRAVLTDFGGAREAGDAGGDTAIGTMAFMPPEQWLLGTYSARADIAGCGAILYWLLTATYPYGDTVATIKASHLAPATALAVRTERLRAASIDERLAAIVLRATDPADERRQATAGQFADELTAWLVQTEPSSTRWRLLVLGTLTALLISASPILFAFFNREFMSAPTPTYSGMPPTRDDFAAWLGTSESDPKFAGLLDALNWEYRAAHDEPRSTPNLARQLLEAKRTEILDAEWGVRAPVALAGAVLALEGNDLEAAREWLTISGESIANRDACLNEPKFCDYLHTRWRGLWAIYSLRVARADASSRNEPLTLSLAQRETFRAWLDAVRNGSPDVEVLGVESHDRHTPLKRMVREERAMWPPHW
ncbi:MAG: serine/threonine-protein kinase [Phycisphaerae bacterium]|nr:serine/threonine-protein kinase [Phycisphaerae bacterium]